ncbi:MAG: hypothetical protein LC792_18485 [Actinobacteria bacterium]|nr:hypothetical protein [Actinomycetota bacterium]
MPSRGPVAARSRRARRERRPAGEATQATGSVEAVGLSLAGAPPEPAAAPPVPPRRRMWSMRAHLWTVVATMLVVLVGAGVVLGARAQKRDRRAAGRAAQFQAALGANEMSEALPDLRSLMMRSANSLGAISGGRLATLQQHCNLSFGEFRVFTGGTLHILLPDGSVVCSSKLAPPGAALPRQPYATAPWLGPTVNQTADKLMALSTGPMRDPVSQHWSMFVVAPISAAGLPRPAGVLALELDLADLGPALIHRFGGPQPVEYLVVDPKGIVVTRSLQPGEWLGKDISGTPVGRTADPRGARRAGLDGTQRLYGSAVVDDSRGDPAVTPLKWRVYAGISTSAADADARAARNDLVQAALVVLPLLMVVTLSGVLVVKRR